MNYAEKFVSAPGVKARYESIRFLRTDADWHASSEIESYSARRAFDYIIGQYVDLGLAEMRWATHRNNSAPGGGRHKEYRWIGGFKGPVPIAAPGADKNDKNVTAVYKAGLEIGVRLNDVYLIDTPEKVKHIDHETVRRTEVRTVSDEVVGPDGKVWVVHSEEPVPPVPERLPVTFDLLQTSIDKLRDERAQVEVRKADAMQQVAASELALHAIDSDIAALTRAAEILIDRGMQ